MVDNYIFIFNTNKCIYLTYAIYGFTKKKKIIRVSLKAKYIIVNPH